MELIADAIERYRRRYGSEPEIVATAPGRVNLIGEHTDYNGGFVLPIAIDRKIVIAAGPRPDRLLNLHAADLQSSASIPLGAAFDPDRLWSNYPAGVASVLESHGHSLGGANLCIRGDIPVASGLSSSAALEVATAVALTRLNGLPLTVGEIIAYSCEAESEFVGVGCGIMDQFVSVRGRSNHALFLDCQTLDYEQVPFPRGAQLIVCDTGVRREVSRTAYNQRRSECGEAVRQIRKNLGDILSLRDLSAELFRSVENRLNPLARRRARHVVMENDRVVRFVAAMKGGDLPEMGRLMTLSHISLRDDFEVSCPELDAFVEIANGTDGVFGARMTGAGFGGCAVCLVGEKFIDDLVEKVKTEFHRHAGRSFAIYLTTPSSGAAIHSPARSPVPESVCPPG